MSKFYLIIRVVFLHIIVFFFIISCSKTNIYPPSAKFSTSKNAVKYNEEFTLSIDDYNESCYYKWEPEYSSIVIEDEGEGEYNVSIQVLGAKVITLTAINENGADSSSVVINVVSY